MLLKSKKAQNVVLWSIQGLLAALFLFAGIMKLTLPVEAMTRQMPLPGVFLRFIGIAEVLGALGLILPGLLKMHRHLTTLAASGLIIIMIGAIVISWIVGGASQTLFPMIVGLLLVAVAYNRRETFTVSKPISLA